MIIYQYLLYQYAPYQSLLVSIVININQVSMGKKIRISAVYQLNPLNYPITKSKSFTANLDGFIKMLKSHHPTLSSKEFLKVVHKYALKCKHKTDAQQNILVAMKKKIKICKECDKWNGSSQTIRCTLCEDYYHDKCLSEKIEGEDRKTWNCQLCKQNNASKEKNKYLEDIMEDFCKKCNIQKETTEAFVECLRCNSRFHKKCYGKSGAVCFNCKEIIEKELSKQQKSLLDYFSPKKNEESNKKCSESEKQKDLEDTTDISREAIRFTKIYQKMTEQQIEGYKKELFYAILAKGMEYSAKLMPLNCSLDNDTEESLDFCLQRMQKVELEAFKAYKKQPFGPFKLVFKQKIGYDVVADRDISNKTLICEYVGDVITFRDCVIAQKKYKNDSLMELKNGRNADESLIIRPEKYTNIARFINGINNKTGKDKANVATVRLLIEGRPGVFLYTTRNIKKGESLLYDYNFGQTTVQYETSDFE